ncbi:MAG: uroporphyrinogen decarboxylase [Anaerolineales bacterium]|nr:uroporphyrinogen decarboxylase [Anaerolineales bacterium]
MITKRERLEAAIAGEVADRPPVALWRHFPVDDQVATSLADASADFQRAYDFDFIKVTPASSFCLKDWGVEDSWRGSSEGTREYIQRVILEPEGWSKLPQLDPTQGSLGEQLRCLQRLKSKFDTETPIIQTVFSPLAQAKNLAGQERLMEHLNRYPDHVEIGLEIITESTIAFVEAALALGIDGIFYAVQHATYRYFDRQTYSRFGERFDRRILERCTDSWLNVLHLHGDAVIFDLAEEYPVQVVNWHDRETLPNLASGKAKIHSAVCGGIRRETMVLGDAQAVGDEASEAIHSLNGRGVILGTGCVVPIIAPRGNLIAARAAVNCV